MTFKKLLTQNNLIKYRKNEADKKRLQLKQRLSALSLLSEEALLQEFNQSMNGFNEEQAELMREKYGTNTLPKQKADWAGLRLLRCLFTPFTLILIALMGISVITDVVMVSAKDQDFSKIIIIFVMITLSTVIRFVQETKSSREAEKLNEMVETTTLVYRNQSAKEIPADEVVAGDLVRLAAGDLVVADVRILQAKDLFISQASLSGESDPLEKQGIALSEPAASVTDSENLAFMGSNVISGSALCMVIAVGSDTFFGSMAESFSEPQDATNFEKGMNAVTKILMRFMLVMVPIVFVINGFTKHDWLSAFMFAVSIAVGMTPEMLPMIVTTCLAKGALVMSKQKTIIKDLNAIQNFGAMDILCTDKTGTLTLDKVALEYHLDVLGNEDSRVLRHAFLNSYFQTGLKNLLDVAIIERTFAEAEHDEAFAALSNLYEKVDEIPYDFNRRRMSVVVKDGYGKTQLITKGAVEEILKICTHVEINHQSVMMSEELRVQILKTVADFNDQGLRVLAVAQKTNPREAGMFGVEDEKDMILIGYLAFLDPPKGSAKSAIASLHEYGTEVKVLTGDSDRVTRSVCEQVGIDTGHIVLGFEIEAMSDDELKVLVEECRVFAKLSPDQKARIVAQLKANGHTVGYMGDGINDAMAMRQADVGISVDTAVDIAKETADVILLEKDLMVLKEGILEGRRTYANTIKYIKMTASSSFGNMFSVLCASAFLPFLPMTSIQLILLSLVYDLSCAAIPWDNVDSEFLRQPRPWAAESISKFMLWMGPISSVFDICTYLLLYFVIAPMAVKGGYHTLTDQSSITLFISVFQTGWFIESMWTQTLVLHTLRSAKLPFIQTRASKPVTLLSLAGIFLLTLLPSTQIGEALGLVSMPLMYYGWLLLIVAGYLVITTVVKFFYIRRYGELL